MDVNKIDISAYQRAGNIADNNIKLINECKTCKLSEKTAEETLLENDMQSVEIVEDDAAMWGEGDKYSYKNKDNVYYEGIEIDGVKGTEYSKLLACKDKEGDEHSYRAVTRQFDDGRAEKVMYQMNDSVTITKDGKEVQMPRKTIEETNTIVQTDAKEASLGGTRLEVAEQVLENKTGTVWKPTNPPTDWDSKDYTAIKDEDGNTTCYVKEIEEADGHKGKQYIKFLQTTDETGKVITAMVDNNQYNDRSSVREITILDEKTPEPETPAKTPSRPIRGGGGGGGGGGSTPTCPTTPAEPDGTGVEGDTGGTGTVTPDDGVDKPSAQTPDDTSGNQGSETTTDTPKDDGGTGIGSNPTGDEIGDTSTGGDTPPVTGDDKPTDTGTDCPTGDGVSTDDSSSIEADLKKQLEP